MVKRFSIADELTTQEMMIETKAQRMDSYSLEDNRFQSSQAFISCTNLHFQKERKLIINPSSAIFRMTKEISSKVFLPRKVSLVSRNIFNPCKVTKAYFNLFFLRLFFSSVPIFFLSMPFLVDPAVDVKSKGKGMFCIFKVQLLILCLIHLFLNLGSTCGSTCVVHIFI